MPLAPAGRWRAASEQPSPRTPGISPMKFPAPPRRFMACRSTRCWTSNVRTFRVGNVQSWRLTYTDSKSEFAIGLYRLVEAHGVGGMSAVSSSSAVDWLRTADALKNVTAGAGGWALSGSKAGDHYRDVPKTPAPVHRLRAQWPAVGGQLNWILGAAFCRESATPIPTSEAAVRRRRRQGQGLSEPDLAAQSRLRPPIRSRSRRDGSAARARRRRS